MIAIAIFSTDLVLRRKLEQLLREDPTMTVVGVAVDPATVLRLIHQNHVDVVLADAPSREQLNNDPRVAVYSIEKLIAHLSLSQACTAR